MAMRDSKVINKYYVYGCTSLLEDIQEIMEKAAFAENSGLTSNQWLNSEGLEHITEHLDSDISWGAAIKAVLTVRTEELTRIRSEKLTNDFPF